MEEGWAALNEAQAGKPATAVEKIWFDTIGRLLPPVITPQAVVVAQPTIHRHVCHHLQ